MIELINKIKSAVVDMYSKVEFDEKEHKYTRKSDGKWLAGISSIADSLPKPYLMPWAAKMVVEFLQDKQEIIKILTPEEYLELLDEAKTTHKRKSGEAMDLGTIGHKFCEEYVLAKIRNTELPKMIKELKRPLEKFIEWEKENVKQWVLSEAMVVDTEEEFAGRLDGLAILKDDKLAVIDFKFSNQISPSYHLQTAGYSIPFSKYDIEIQDRIIIRLPKTPTKKVYNKETKQYTEEENNIEIARSPFDMAWDCENFRHARAIYKYINLVE